MQPLYTIKCSRCGGTGKELQEDRIRNESWYDTCKYCSGTGKEPIYSEADYLKMQQEIHINTLQRERTYLKQEIEHINEKLLKMQARLQSVLDELKNLDGTT